MSRISKFRDELVNIYGLPPSIIGKINHDQKRRAKKAKFWCHNCDAQLVGEYGKCPVCGCRNGNKRFKKC